MPDYAASLLLAALEAVRGFVDTDFFSAVLSGFLGSAGGVWLAFWIQRRHEARQATARYVAQLAGCRQELIELRERAEKMGRQIQPGHAIIVSFEAPALQALLASPEMERQSGYGFFVAIIALSNHFKAVENTLQYLRLSAAMGHLLTDAQAAHIKRELGVAERTTVYVRNLVDAELSKLEHKAKPTAKDDQIVAELMKAARGEGNGS